MKSYHRELNIKELRIGKATSGSFPAHIHEDVELMCVESGTHIALVDGKRYELNTGAILLVCPNQIHSYERNPENNVHYCVLIKPGKLGEIGAFLSANKPVDPVLCIATSDPVWQLIKMGCDEMTRNGEQDILYQLMQVLFGMICREMKFTKRETTDQRTVSKILRYCAEHFREDISVKTLSEAMYLSPSHISHIFSDKLMISFPDFINSLRSAEAAKLLVSGQYTISEAAALAGFTTIRTFNRAFKNSYGVTPKEYRKK